MAAKLLWGSLVLTPIALAAHYVFDVSETLALRAGGSALWCRSRGSIGEATEHVAEHTGPGVGGFVNASFGNAPELIIALLAIADGLPNVVRGSIAGSVVSNLLLVLGAAMLARRGGEARPALDRPQPRNPARRGRAVPHPVDPRLAREPRARRRCTS